MPLNVRLGGEKRTSGLLRERCLNYGTGSGLYGFGSRTTKEDIAPLFLREGLSAKAFL